MGQRSLIYAFVSRGTVILAEYTEFSGNFNSIAFQCLQKLPSANNKFTYNCDGHTFNYLVDNGYSTFCFRFLLVYCLFREKILDWGGKGRAVLLRCAMCYYCVFALFDCEILSGFACVGLVFSITIWKWKNLEE